MIKKKCLQCYKEFKTYYSKFCSNYCYHLNAKGKCYTGERLQTAQKAIKKAIEAREKNPEIRSKWILKMKEVTLGDKNHRWLEDRSKLVSQDERNSYQYVEWRRNVWIRDKWKCRINNENCNGKIEVHHILSWKDYPELHYKINNGITLCHAHHPRVRAEEKRLTPFFKELVSVSN